MHGNTPYAGEPGVGDDLPELSPGTRRALQKGVSRVAAKTRRFLPDEYAVGSQIGRGTNGLEVTVSVHPPVGNPVSAGFTPDLGTDREELIPPEDEDEVARGLAASAALQVKQAMGEDVTQIAR